MEQTRPASIELPAAPPLDLKQLVVRSAKSELSGELEAFLPAGAPYLTPREDAPALVLVPGLGMDAMGFVRQLPLGALSHLHLFQMPNDPIDCEDGLGCYARHVEEYILAAGLDKHPGGVIVGGCSMGGAVSLAVAVRRRVNLRGLVLIGTFGSCRHLPSWQRRAAPLSRILPLAFLRTMAWAVVARTPLFGVVNSSEAEWLVSFRLRRTQRYFHSAIMAITRQEQIDAAAALQVPTIVLHGKRDHVLPFAAGVELAETIPGARFVPLEDSGHSLFFTHHETVNTAIADFISTLPPSV
ncbi:MAG TPA: alpha/beta hydrolase [Planctomycetota bacterium]|nr:alpha/beta hydrolase [Planctomycetota bacterium]